MVFSFSMTMYADIELVRTAQRERRNNSSSVFLYWQPMSRESRERETDIRNMIANLRNTIAQHEKYISVSLYWQPMSGEARAETDLRMLVSFPAVSHLSSDSIPDRGRATTGRLIFSTRFYFDSTRGAGSTLDCSQTTTVCT